VHYCEIDGIRFHSLEENQQVEFEVTEGPQAARPRLSVATVAGPDVRAVAATWRVLVSPARAALS
jgi:hypothetical protein